METDDHTAGKDEAESKPSQHVALGGWDVYQWFTSTRKEIILVLSGWGLIISAPAPTKAEVAVDESKAKEFLGSLKRQKRQLWDRSRPEVQQWYQQFLYMGFDEAVGILFCWGPGFCRAVWLGENRAQKLASLFAPEVWALLYAKGCPPIRLYYYQYEDISWNFPSHCSNGNPS